MQAARAAMADLLGADPAGIVFGRSMTQLTFDLARTLAQGWTSRDEVLVSRLDHDANVRPWLIWAERAGATVRWIDFDPESTELTAQHVGDQLTEQHPAGRADRRVEPDRQPAGPGGDRRRGAPGRRAALRRRGTPDRACRHRHGRARRRLLQPARRTSSSARTAGCWPPSPAAAGRACIRTSCCRPPMPSRSVSNSARCPTNCWPARPRRSISSPAWPRAAGRRIGGSGSSASMRAADEHEDALRAPHRTRACRAGHRHAALAGATANARPCCSPSPAGPSGCYRFLAELGVNAPAGTFYAYEPARRLGPAGRRAADRAGALHRRLGRRPAARRADRIPQRIGLAWAGPRARRSEGRCLGERSTLVL